MQVTIINKVNAQVIHGPANHTYVNPISPYIRYNWDISGLNNVNYTVVYGTTTPSAENEWADISWNWANLPANPEIVITEEPIYDVTPLDLDYYKEAGVPINNPTADDQIQTLIDAVALHIKNNGGTGVVELSAGTYLIDNLHLAAGVRLVGAGAGFTTLKRFTPLAPGSYSAMLTTYWTPACCAYTWAYSFLPLDEMNSKPIEISNMTIDGDVTIPVEVLNPQYGDPQYPNAPQIIPNPNPNAYEQTPLIYLVAPHFLNPGASFYVKGPNNLPDPNPGTHYTSPYTSGGSGKLKVFIHHIDFKNSGGDAVHQLENVDLNMHHCTGDNIYRGTFTLSGGADYARLQNITTSTSAGVLTKSIDTEGDHLGYGGVRKFRLWMDNCQFDKNVQLDFRCSNVLMTNTDIGHQPTTIIGYSHGDIVTNDCTLPFLRVHGETPNFIMAPKHAKFNNTIFLFESPTPAPLDVPVDGCFNGIYYKNHTVINIGTQQNPILQDVYYKDAHIGFNNCTFTDAMTAGYPQKYGFYIFDHPTQLATQNHSENLQLYFNNNTVANTFTSPNLPILYTASCPTSFATTFASGVINDNEVYTGGESEDEMKTHFGIRKLDLDEFPCNPSLIGNTNIDKWDNPKASAIIAHYNMNNNNGSIIDNKEIYINGIFTIDADITFENNCTLWFTQTGKVKLVGAHTFTVDESILQAACDYWLGIEADDPQQKVTIENESYIKKAGIGLHASNGAVIEITGSHFEDNINYAIQIENITGNYLGIVNNNTFSHTNIPPANYPPPYMKTGIGITNVSHLNIGDLGVANSGNLFEDLNTGISISHSLNTVCEIGIYNNEFDNIVDNSFGGGNIQSQKINACYYNERGTAILAKFNGIPNVVTRLIDVRNTNIANPNLQFENCDKGIVSVSFPVRAQNLFMDHCLMGVMNTSTTARVYDIKDNTINNTFIGMQFIGDNANSIASNNTILHDPSLTWLPTNWPPVLGQQYIWPIGIDLKYAINTNPNSFLIEDNTITISDFAGKGISLNNTSAQVKARINTINLSNSDVSPFVCNGASDLNGISVENGKGTKILKNYIYGNVNGGLLAQAREDMAGILINKTTDHETQCNYIEKTRFGVMAWNNCGTDKLNVKGNTVHESVLGWAFRHLVNEGSFGQVGDAGNENNNTFTGPQPSAKVFKFCENQLLDKIYTNLILPGESQSINLNTNVSNDCFYFIQSNPGATPFTACANLIVANNTSSISLAEALAIANDTKEYAEYPELGHWYDSKLLYEYLQNNESFKNSHADLITFYNTMSNNAIAQEQVAEQWLIDLIEAYTQGNNAIIEGLQNGTYTANNNIDDTELQDANEAMINSIYLKILSYGLDSVTQADSTFIVELAPQCPYVGGSAVFKARTLNAYYHPGNMFDDMKLCNQVGVFKQGGNNSESDKSKLAKENEYLQELKLVKPTILSLIDEIVYYPNPANDYINIQFKSEYDAMFTLYNSLGEKLFSKKLSKSITRHRIDLDNVASGLYHFEIEYTNKVKSIGKITVVN